MHPLGPAHAYLNGDEIVRLIAYKLVASQATATAVALAHCYKNLEDLLSYVS